MEVTGTKGKVKGKDNNLVLSDISNLLFETSFNSKEILRVTIQGFLKDLMNLFWVKGIPLLVLLIPLPNSNSKISQRASGVRGCRSMEENLLSPFIFITIPSSLVIIPYTLAPKKIPLFMVYSYLI